MKKKNYIFVLTFLCMFVGQMGYAYGGDPYGIGEKVDTHNVCDEESVDYNFCECYPDAVTCNEIALDDAIIYSKCDERNPNYYDNLCECEPEWCADPIYEEDETDCNGDINGSAYEVSCGCIGGSTGIDECPEEEEEPQGPGEPEQKQTWYLDFDGDNYHATTYRAVDSPGDKWKLYTNGEDCDDARPQYTTVCCTKTCESGYELNVDICECAELPPCFGTIKDFETSNAFNSNTILNKLNSTLGDFGISTDVMDIIKQMDLFDPKTIANGTDLVKFADNMGVVGDGLQVTLDVAKYMDEPSTQNLLKTVLDLASMTLTPAASLALSTIDYFKDSNGNSKLDLLLKAAGDAIDRSLDCNLGLGIRNAPF